MKGITKIIMVVLLCCFTWANAQENTEKEVINKILKAWHKAAATANYNEYFSYMTNDAVFIGTDATENWQNKAFKTFSKPYFDKGKAWSFTAIERNVYLSNDANFAWFDELLDTQMKICRGSGVLQKVDGEWKVKHYVLSMTIPNENVGEVVKLKEVAEDQIIKRLKSTN